MVTSCMLRLSKIVISKNQSKFEYIVPRGGDDRDWEKCANLGLFGAVLGN